jgi:hypothetical protein
MVKQLPIRTETKSVRHLDAFPQLRHFPRRIDTEERSRRRRAFEVKGMDIAAERTGPNTALVVYREIIQSEQWLSLPFREEIAYLSGLFIPLGEGSAGNDETTSLVERDSANELTLWDQRLDPTIRITAKYTTTPYVTVIEPVLFIRAWTFEKSVASR